MAVSDGAPAFAVAPTKGSHQTWVTAFLWNANRRRRGYRTTVLLDTGAGGGSYASVKFIHAVERTEYGGRRIVSKRGRGRLRAANPTDSGVAPMNIIGTAILPLVFPPVDRIFRARVRVVEGLPFGFILGAAFMRHYSSIIDFEGAGSFKPTKDSRAVPLLPPKPSPSSQPWRERVQTMQPENPEMRCSVPGWRAAHRGVRSGRVRCEVTGNVTPRERPQHTADTGPTRAMFCALDWYEEKEPDCDGEPDLLPHLAAMEAKGLDPTAWEDEGCLSWPMTLVSKQDLPGRVSALVEASLPGPQPHTEQLLVVFPRP